jgi:hypothetical protein
MQAKLVIKESTKNILIVVSLLIGIGVNLPVYCETVDSTAGTIDTLKQYLQQYPHAVTKTWMQNFIRFSNNQITGPGVPSNGALIDAVCDGVANKKACESGSFSFSREIMGATNTLAYMLGHCPQSSGCKDYNYMLEESMGQLKFYLKVG